MRKFGYFFSAYLLLPILLAGDYFTGHPAFMYLLGAVYTIACMSIIISFFFIKFILTVGDRAQVSDVTTGLKTSVEKLTPFRVFMSIIYLSTAILYSAFNEHFVVSTIIIVHCVALSIFTRASKEFVKNV